MFAGLMGGLGGLVKTVGTVLGGSGIIGTLWNGAKNLWNSLAGGQKSEVPNDYFADIKKKA